MANKMAGKDDQLLCNFVLFKMLLLSLSAEMTKLKFRNILHVYHLENRYMHVMIISEADVTASLYFAYRQYGRH